MDELSKIDPTPAVLKGIPVIDSDTHISEWDDLWTSRTTPKYKDRVPQKRTVDGQRIWFIDGDKSLGPGQTSAIRKDGWKCRDMGFMKWDITEAHDGAHDVKQRLRYMDEAGIHAQIGYPNLLGFGAQRASLVDPDLRLVSVKIYNDAMAEYQAASGERVFPMALLPWWDVKEAVAETKRCRKMGLRGVNTNSDPNLHGLPNLGDPHWNPLWEACVADDMPVNFHIGASDDTINFAATGHWCENGSNVQLAYGSIMLFLGNARVLTNIFLSGFLERFPTLKIVSVESGVGWLPFLLEAVEYEMNETGMKYTATPYEIFQRQIYGCAWFERRNFVPLVRMLGTGNIMFETDFPHPTCLYPDALQYTADMAAQFTHEERVNIFGANAARVYNIPLPAAA
jgi:predicted TIM-barrel fold metal-dependent hydrolase